ncbi:intradiol ring-cleavage dioxygenase [Massilia sp. TN1-12]|uniref:dioxygenase family protein n=1 Tax=Massilia paldalensis TaxID=3377675 RepID=UPI00384B4816
MHEHLGDHGADHARGLQADLERLLSSAADRRTSLRWLFAGVGAAGLPLAGCGGGSDGSDAASAASSTVSTGTTGTTGSTTTGSTTTGSTGSTGTGCAVIPEETAGPYPGDGSNRNAGGVANALTLSGIVRRDICASVGSGTATAAGTPLTVRLQLVNVGASCATIPGSALYLWHCDRDGNYSMYASGLTSENYLRGVQEADADGVVTFTTIFPGCYAGRMPHVHFEVYRSLSAATSAANKIKTSQFTFPLDVLNTVYATSGYASSARNLSGISYATDNVFNDGVTLQMGTVTGSVTEGYTVTLTVGVSL